MCKKEKGNKNGQLKAAAWNNTMFKVHSHDDMWDRMILMYGFLPVAITHF
jgi:hypothetical protein